MVAPGKNLEFSETSYYTAKMAPAIELSNAIAEHLRSWPSAGDPVCGRVRQFIFKQGKQSFAVVYSRQGQLVGLMNVFEMPLQEKELALYLATVKVTDRAVSSRRKP